MILGLGKASIVGLDVGFHSVKIVEIAAGKRQRAVKRVVVVPTGNTPDMPDEERQQRLIQLLQSVWKELGLRTRRVHTIIPGRAVFYRPLKIPIVTGDRLEKIVRYEAKQQIPFPLDQILLDYHIFGGTGGELEGILIAIRRDTISDHVRLLARAGLRPDSIEESSVCLFNATRAIEREPEEVIGIVNIGATTTDIIIEHQHVLKFRRSAPVAGNELTLALQNTLERSFGECEDLKTRFGRLSTGIASRFEGLPPEWEGQVDESTLVDTLDTVFDRVVTEIRRSIDYYISQPDGMAVSRLLISGGTTELPGTVEFLEDRLGIPVQRLEPDSACPIDLADVLTEETTHSALAACGLAVPVTSDHHISMNFIPETIQQRQAFESKRSYMVIQGLFLILLVGMSVMYLVKQLQFRQEVLEYIRGVINIEKGKIGEELARVRTQQDEMRRRFTMLRDISLRRGKVMDNLLEVVKITPTSFVSITSINIEHDHMLVKGRASDDMGVKAFMEEIRLSPFIREMRNVTEEGSGDAFTFRVTDLHEPNEKEMTFYSGIRPKRLEVPLLRNFIFGTQKDPDAVQFEFYMEGQLNEELCRQFSTVLEELINSKIKWSTIIYSLFNPSTEKRVNAFRIENEADAMKLYHGEIEIMDYIEEFWKKRDEELAARRRSRRRS